MKIFALNMVCKIPLTAAENLVEIVIPLAPMPISFLNQVETLYIKPIKKIRKDA